MNHWIKALTYYAHSFATIATMEAQIDKKNAVAKRAIYCITLDRKLDEYFKTTQA